MSSPPPQNSEIGQRANYARGPSALDAKIIVIEGPPCSGKSTLARRLGQELGFSVTLEPAGREVFRADVGRRIGDARRELMLAVLQWRWLWRAASSGGVVADFSPFKAAVRLEMRGEGRLARVAAALARSLLQRDGAVVVLQAPVEVLVERWQERGPDPIGPNTAARLAMLAEAYDRFFGRTLDVPVLRIEVGEKKMGRICQEILRWLSSIERTGRKIQNRRERS